MHACSSVFQRTDSQNVILCAQFRAHESYARLSFSGNFYM